MHVKNQAVLFSPLWPITWIITTIAKPLWIRYSIQIKGLIKNAYQMLPRYLHFFPLPVSIYINWLQINEQQAISILANNWTSGHANLNHHLARPSEALSDTFSSRCHPSLCPASNHIIQQNWMLLGLQCRRTGHSLLWCKITDMNMNRKGQPIH